jgi:hypothetical protein
MAFETLVSLAAYRPTNGWDGFKMVAKYVTAEDTAWNNAGHSGK